MSSKRIVFIFIQLVMKIENQIKELLFLHDCVIVPNFGAFLSQDKNATLDSSTQQFQPPYKAISFNSSLKKNDGLLVNELKNKYKLEYDQALEIIQNQVNFWKEHLESGKDLVLDKIGNLKLLAKSEDGIVEAIQVKDKKFIVGLQWHPESMFTYDNVQYKIFKYFINICKRIR